MQPQKSRPRYFAPTVPLKGRFSMEFADVAPEIVRKSQDTHRLNDSKIMTSLDDHDQISIETTNAVAESSNTIKEPNNGVLDCSSHDSADLTFPNAFARFEIRTPERRSHQQLRMVHTLPAPTAQNIQLRISQAEESELRRTEAASW